MVIVFVLFEYLHTARFKHFLQHPDFSLWWSKSRCSDVGSCDQVLHFHPHTSVRKNAHQIQKRPCGAIGCESCPSLQLRDAREHTRRLLPVTKCRPQTLLLPSACQRHQGLERAWLCDGQVAQHAPVQLHAALWAEFTHKSSGIQHHLHSITLQLKLVLFTLCDFSTGFKISPRHAVRSKRVWFSKTAWWCVSQCQVIRWRSSNDRPATKGHVYVLLSSAAVQTSARGEAVNPAACCPPIGGF